MSNVKLFKGWLTESTEAANPGPAISWATPVKATISKAAGKGGNVIEVKTGSGRVFNYKIIGVALGKEYAINFNWLKKTAGGDMTIGRTIQGGVDPVKVDYSDLAEILPKLVQGQPKAEDITLGVGVRFEKI